ncbi:MAG: hypothetical protein RL410_1245 [Actinomycetota bacterium]
MTLPTSQTKAVALSKIQQILRCYLRAMSRRSLVLFAALSVIWGLPYLFIKYSIAELDATMIVLLRTLPSAIVLLAWSAFKGNLRANLTWWKPALLFGFVEMVFPWWLITEAEKELDSGLTGLLLATVPLFGVIIARLSGDKTASSPKRMLGLLIGLAGVGMLMGLNPQDVKIPLLQVGMVLIGAIGYAIGPFTIAKTVGKADPITIIGMSLGFVGVLYIPLGLAHIPTHMPSALALWSVAVLTLVCTVAAFIVFFSLIAEVGGIKATLVTYINPAVAIALGIVLLKEPVTLGLLIGFPMVLGGSWLASKH